MKVVVVMLWVLLALAVAGSPAGAAPEGRPVGLVKTVSGEAYLLRNGVRLAAVPGQQLVLGDTLVTGAAGSLGVILRDDTVLSLGPSSQTGIERFAYEPAQGQLGMVLRVARGLIEYLSGKISKLAPGSVRIETPVATLGIRGTHLLARIEP